MPELAMKERIGWKVHGWRYPIVWWARRKPRSRIRQWAWAKADRIEWWRVHGW